MPLLLVLGLAAFGLLVWVGRRPARLSDGARLASALVSALAAVAAIVSAARGGWIASLLLILFSTAMARRAQLRFRTSSARRPSGLSLEQARDILGVGENASTAEITAAYRRLMRTAHPDQGGSDAWAARVNAARDRLRGQGGG